MTDSSSQPGSTEPLNDLDLSGIDPHPLGTCLQPQIRGKRRSLDTTYPFGDHNHRCISGLESTMAFAADWVDRKRSPATGPRLCHGLDRLATPGEASGGQTPEGNHQRW